MAASTALPFFFKISTPTLEHCGASVATAACRYVPLELELFLSARPKPKPTAIQILMVKVRRLL